MRQGIHKEKEKFLYLLVQQMQVKDWLFGQEKVKKEKNNRGDWKNQFLRLFFYDRIMLFAKVTNYYNYFKVIFFFA